MSNADDKPKDQLPLVRGRQETASFVDQARKLGQKIVFVNGCFDLLHPGHIQVFFEAQALGDVLVVAMNSDQSIEALKGSSRPILAESVRLTMASALKPVDAAFCFDESNASEALKFIKPDIYAKGAQYRGQSYPESETVQALGIELQYLTQVEGFSTSLLIEHIKSQRGKFGN